MGWCQKPYKDQVVSYKLDHSQCQSEKLHRFGNTCLDKTFRMLSLTSLFPRDLQMGYLMICI